MIYGIYSSERLYKKYLTQLSKLCDKVYVLVHDIDDYLDSKYEQVVVDDIYSLQGIYNIINNLNLSKGDTCFIQYGKVSQGVLQKCVDNFYSEYVCMIPCNNSEKQYRVMVDDELYLEIIPKEDYRYKNAVADSEVFYFSCQQLLNKLNLVTDALKYMSIVDLFKVVGVRAALFLIGE